MAQVEIFIAVSGGVVQGVRAAPKGPHSNPDGEFRCYVVDYDNYDTDGCDAPYPGTEEDFEREHLDGRTWAEIEATSVGVY